MVGDSTRRWWVRYPEGMASAAYDAWVRAGRPWRLASPIIDLQQQAGRAGIPVLGTIGNSDHLMAPVPEDHTPFSATAWPVPLRGYVVCAIDLGDGPWSDRILTRVRAGELPWLKYMNFRGHHYNRKRGFAQESSGDGHLHISTMSDHVDTGVPGNVFADSITTPAPRKDRTMFVLELRRAGKPSDWFVSDGLRYRSIVTGDSLTLYRDMSGHPDVVVPTLADLEIWGGTRDQAEGSVVASLTDDQVHNLVSAINAQMDTTGIRQVLRQELAGVRLVPGA